MRPKMPEMNTVVPHRCGKARVVPSGAMLDVFMGVDVGATLNAEARYVFEHVDGVASIGSIVDRMANEYDAPHDVIEQDVVETLLEMKEIGLLTW